jgi:hypothetical protein
MLKIKTNVSVASILIILFMFLSTGFLMGTPASKPTRIMILVTGENGEWTSQIQSNLTGNVLNLPAQINSESGFNLHLISPTAGFNKEAISKLGKNQVSELLRYPSVIRNSENLGRILEIDYLAEINVIKTENNWWSRSIITDVNNSTTMISHPKQAHSSREAVDAALSELTPVIQSLQSFEKDEKSYDELEKIDPAMVKYLKTNPVYRQKDRKYVERLTAIMKMIKLPDEKPVQATGLETPPQKIEPPKRDYELIPIDQAENLIKNITENIRPPQKIPAQ